MNCSHFFLKASISFSPSRSFVSLSDCYLPALAPENKQGVSRPMAVSPNCAASPLGATNQASLCARG